MSARTNAADHAAGSNLESLERSIGEIELGLAADDPEFVRRFDSPVRARRINATVVVALLLSTTVLLAVGLAALSWFAVVAGAATFIGAFAVDDRYRRRHVPAPHQR